MKPFSLSRAIRFLGVGGLSTAVYWVILLGLSTPLRVNPMISSIIAYLAGFATAYLGHRNITYRSRAFVGPELARFLTVSALCFCGGNLAFWTAVNRFHLPVVAGGMLLTAVNVGTAFLAYEFWVFRPKA